jgi:hypothetical protein
MFFLVSFKFILVIADFDFSVDLVLLYRSHVGVYAEIDIFREYGRIFAFYYFA